MGKINRRGFNLFTALVSFLFITLTVLLWQSMIQSERKTSEMFGDAQQRMEMEAIADTAITDSVQTFNYALRFKVARYVAPGGPPENSAFSLEFDKPWADLKNAFAKQHFGSDDCAPGTPPPCGVEALAVEISQSLKTYFRMLWDFKTYTIKVENMQDDDTLKEVMKNLIKAEANSNTFFNVIGCSGNPGDDEGECPLGTFYINLDATQLSSEDYEKLPRMVITNTATHNEIRQPILPSSTIRIYVPLRLFKAVAEARGLAHFTKSGTRNIDELVANPSAGDIGFLSENFTNEVNGLQLGLCYANNCNPSRNPEKAPVQKEFLDNGCPGDPAIRPNTKILLNLDYLGCTWCSSVQSQLPPRYNANFTINNSSGESRGPDVVADIARARICSLAKEAQAEAVFATSPEFVVSSSSGDCPDLVTTERVSSMIMEKKKLTRRIDSFIPVTYDLPETSRGTCTKPSEMEVILTFKDTNPNYTIVQGQAINYAMRLVGKNSILEQETAGSFDQPGWECLSEVPNIMGGPEPTKCKLP